MIDFKNETIDSLHQKLVNKETTAVELVETAYDNILANDATIKAFITLNIEEAYKKAERIDKEGIEPHEILKGIPYAAKDNLLTKDLRTTGGSRMLEYYVPTYTATLVERLNAAGMIMVGKANLDEFAMGSNSQSSYFKTSINIWDEDANPGGSSGGSVGAVASGQVPVSLGTDTGGSIRQPAAYQNLVGLKPTYGLVSRYGVIPSAPSLDTIGPITQTVKGNAQILQAMAGYDENDATSFPDQVKDFTKDIEDGVEGLVIGLVDELEDERIDSTIREAVLEAAEFYHSKGATIKHISLPHMLYSSDTYNMLNNAEGSESLARYDGVHYGLQHEEFEDEEEQIIRARTVGFGKEVKRRIINGMRITSDEQRQSHYGQAAKVRTLVKADFDRAFESVDLILTPTIESTAPHKEDYTVRFMEDNLEQAVNLAGLPALTVPAGFIDEMPFGIQLIGNMLDEPLLYRTGYTFEQANDFYTKHPAMDWDYFK